MASPSAPLPPNFCTGCQRQFKAHGFASHERKCMQHIERQRCDQEYEANLRAIELRSSPKRSECYVHIIFLFLTFPTVHKQQRLVPVTEPKTASTSQDTGMCFWCQDLTYLTQEHNFRASCGGCGLGWHNSTRFSSRRFWTDLVWVPWLSCLAYYNISPSNSDGASTPRSSSHHTDTFQIDDIRTEYHPSSGRPTQVDSFDDFGKTDFITLPPILNQKPWLPFHSQAEYTFAEIALQSAMSNKQLDALIKVVHTLMKGKEHFELKSHCDVQDLWNRASDSLTPVSCW